MQGVHLREYGVQTTIDFELYEVDGVDLRVDWVPAAADCEVMKDEGASTQCTNTATDEGSTYSIVLTATEMQAARLVLKIVDAATKVFLDKVIVIETYGHASAMHLNFPSDITHVMGTILTEGGAGRLAAAIIKLFDVASPLLVASDVMRGTNSANTVVPDAAGVAPTAAEIKTAIEAAGSHITLIKAVTDVIPDSGALTTIAADTARLTAARAQAIDDWINGGRLDLILDIIAADTTTDIPALIATAQSDLDTLTGSDGATLATAQGLYAPAKAGDLMGLANDAITSAKYDESTAFPVKSADSGATEIARTGADSDTLETLSDEIAGVSAGDATATNQTTIITAIEHATYGLSAIRTRGDAAWITGGGGGITDMVHLQTLIPSTIDLADTATVRIGLGITNMIDDLPTTVEITPGTITIDRKAYGGTAWTNVVNAAACSEAAGNIYYDEVFDSTTGYRPGDSIRITFKGQKITVSANDYEITPTDGWMFQTYIRGAERADAATATHTYTVLDGDSNGISDVLVEAKLTGTTILVQTARTNSSGVATFYLAPGTYDFYATKSGYSFSNPDSETVF